MHCRSVESLTTTVDHVLDRFHLHMKSGFEIDIIHRGVRFVIDCWWGIQ